MSHALRHLPEQYSLTLDAGGWAELEAFSSAMQTTVENVLEIANQDNKQRFTIRDGRIRAAQGHSFPVNLELTTPTTIPRTLWHGTTEEAYEIIRVQGLLPMKRQHVHLSASGDQAVIVGSRRKGKVIVLQVSTIGIEKDLLVSENGVWLTNHVPPENISSES